MDEEEDLKEGNRSWSNHNGNNQQCKSFWCFYSKLQAHVRLSDSDRFVMTGPSPARFNVVCGNYVIQFSCCPPKVVGVSWFSRVGAGRLCIYNEGRSPCRIWTDGFAGRHDVPFAGLRPVGGFGGCGGSGLAVGGFVRLPAAAMAGDCPPDAVRIGGCRVALA